MAYINVGTKVKQLSVAYSCGHIVQIVPAPNGMEDYYDTLESIRALSFIVSDGKTYDLSNVSSIYSISVQNYSKPENDYGLGHAGTLEYLLTEKAFNCSIRKPDLGIAYLRKAVELMKISDVEWSRQDFRRLVWRFNDFGAKSDALELDQWYKSNVLTDEQEAELIVAGKLNKKLLYIHKEIITVKRVTTEDMMQFIGMPYQLNGPIIKHIEHGSHPFAYMDLSPFNQEIAKKDLSRLNALIKKDIKYSPKFSLNVKKIEFSKYSPDYGYTKLICTPHTFSGKISKFPISLSFATRMDVQSYQALGSICYLQDGSIGKAEAHIWRRTSYSSPGQGRSFYFKSVGDELTLFKSECH